MPLAPLDEADLLKTGERIYNLERFLKEPGTVPPKAPSANWIGCWNNIMPFEVGKKAWSQRVN